MSALTQFLAAHWILTGAFLVIFVALLAAESYAQLLQSHRVSPEQAIRLMNDEEAVILDIRGDQAFSEGHIINAVHIPVAQFDAKKARLKNKQKPIILVGERETTTQKIFKRLKQDQFEKLFYLSGGMKAWMNAGLPVEKALKTEEEKKHEEKN